MMKTGNPSGRSREYTMNQLTLLIIHVFVYSESLECKMHYRG